MKRLLLPLIALLCMTSCIKEDNGIGLGLQDPSTLYNGQTEVWNCQAYTVRDDSLNTTNYAQGLLGHYADATFGSAEAVVFTQVAYPAEGALNFSATPIDSCVLSLSLSNPFPKAVAVSDQVQIHFEVVRLAEDIITKDDDGTSHTYYSFDSIKVNRNEVLFNGVVTMHNGDTAVRMPLNNTFKSLLEGRDFADNDALISALHGIRIRILGSEDMMFTINFDAAQSGIFVYRTYEGDPLMDALSIGAAGTHFNQYILQHSATLSAIDGGDSLSGTQRLYLEPMGGTRIKIDLDAELQRFRAQHPLAVVHYAELQLPVAEGSDNDHPESLLMMKRVNDTLTTLAPDMADPISSSSLDYTYNRNTNAYHLRATQHIQRLLRQGSDHGTYVLINSRRASARRAIINGTQAAVPTRLVIVYTEL
ncbi:MAG: DUF4270 family protein [Bacteroidales bacterium]|nr:DUF4270 family protein [Bacteroidales bacterium]